MALFPVLEITLSNKSGHIQCGSRTNSSAKYGSSPAHRSGITVNRSHTNERAALSAREIAWLWNFCEQAGGRSNTNTFESVESVSKLFEVVLNVFTHLSIDSGKLIVESFYDNVDALSALRGAG
ncbi:Uncharacterised protein [Escherichia coli]|nr:Uncharacterised protein [Escherichia coli]CAD5879896.1 Uncharacterised protein [Escherichia coli]